MTALVHRPVLLEAVLAGLNIQPAGVYVDGTYGRGGHAGAVLTALGPAGRLLAFDKDPAAVAVAEKRAAAEPRFSIVHGAYTMLEAVARQQNLTGRIHGVLLDLGVSSPQLDDAARGFSFQHDGPLDMRMNPQAGPSAAEWLAQAEEAEIARVLKEYGEERFARRIARAIVEQREQTPLTTTGQLADLIARAVPTRERGKHPATRSFQALRIAVNNELGELRDVLQQTVRVLAPGGRLVAISFHSLEDRIVKRFMREQAQTVAQPSVMQDLPYLPAGGAKPALRVIGKAVQADASEVAANPRARSAVLRVAEKLP